MIYLRQSSPRQVQGQHPLDRASYGLSEEALRLGWDQERILTVDGDLGVSGRDTDKRNSYKQLVSRVCQSEVGAIFALEVAILARNNAELFLLLEFCALTDTIVIDADGIYDLHDFNDRMILGLKARGRRPSCTSWPRGCRARSRHAA